MKDQIKIAIATILVFVAGVGTGIWTQHIKTPPPPPFGPCAEFERQHPGKRLFAKRFRPERMEKMREKMEKIKPQIEEFQKKLDAIREKDKEKMVALLREDQKTKFNELQARREKMIERVKGMRPSMPFGKEKAAPMVKHFEFLSIIIYKPLLERISRELNLDERQKKAFEEILLERRKETLDLLDSTPPPSMEVWDQGPVHPREFNEPFGGPEDDHQPSPPPQPKR